MKVLSDRSSIECLERLRVSPKRFENSTVFVVLHVTSCSLNATSTTESVAHSISTHSSARVKRDNQPGPSPSAATAVTEAPRIAKDEADAILNGLKPPKRERPVIAVIGINDA